MAKVMIKIRITGNVSSYNNLHYEKFQDGTVKCIEEEIPFEVPEGWEWCRMENICPYGETESFDSSNISDDEWILDLEDIEKETGKILYFATKKERDSKSNKHKFSTGQLLYSKLRPYLNKVVIAPQSGYCTSEILPLYFYGNISPNYMQCFLMSDTFLAYVNLISYGLKMPRLGTNDGKKALIAIPPRNEQDRIVNVCQAAFNEIEKLQIEKECLQDIVCISKNKILDLAIRGKLVPQDPNDEPASVLLERIRIEKEVLVKQGKLKRNKKESIIYKGDDNSYYEKLADGTVKNITEEIPYELPIGWQWSRVQSFIKLTGGAQPPKSTFEYEPTDENIRLIQIRDYKTDAFITYIPKEKARRFCNESDVMIGRYGPPLFQILRGIEGAYNVALMKAETDSRLMSKEYLYYLLQDSELLRTLESVSDRTCGQDGINMFVLNNYLLPIPPLNEQQRIISKLELVLLQLKTIEASLT